jgi:hypothetical protein
MSIGMQEEDIATNASVQGSSDLMTKPHLGGCCTHGHLSLRLMIGPNATFAIPVRYICLWSLVTDKEQIIPGLFSRG